MENNLIPTDDANEFPFEFRTKPVSDKIRVQNWNGIMDGINETALLSIKRRRIFFSMAAVVIVLFAVGAAWFYYSGDTMPRVTEYKTGFAQLKTIVLPDSTKLVLNANSSIKIPNEWKVNGDRQVWLNGEAYFEVTKQKITNQKFIVHTSLIDVEVLGTKFNVNTRRSQSIVALKEGKVQLLFNGSIIKTITKPTVVLTPGEIAKVDSNLAVIISEDQHVDQFSDWVKNEYHFDKTPLTEISKMIEEIYGYEIVVENPVLLNREISGDLMAANIREFVTVLQAALNLKIEIENNTIKISQP